MRKLILTLVLLVIFISLPVLGDTTVITGYTPSDYEKITVTTAAVKMLDTTKAATAGAVFITVELNNIRYRIDSGDPAITDGHLVSASGLQSLWLVDPNSIRNLRMIAIANDARVIVTYYRRVS